MAYDVRISSGNCAGTSHTNYIEKLGDSSTNEKLIFISVRNRGLENRESIQDIVLDEIVRVHGNSILCPEKRIDLANTFVKSITLPLSDSSVKKVAVGSQYIGLLLSDGRVCRLQHRLKSSTVKGKNATARSQDGVRTGNGTTLQIASDEIYARTLQDNLERQRGTSRSLTPSLVFPSTSHDHHPRLARLSRRYEPYRGRRLSLLPNLFEVEERASVDQPYRSTSSSVVLSPRPGQVFQFQRISGAPDIPFDNLPRHIPVIIGQTVRLPERGYSETVQVPHPSLEDALNARRSHGAVLNSLGEYYSSEANDYNFNLPTDHNILPETPPPRPLDEQHSFEGALNRANIRAPISADVSQGIALDSNITRQPGSSGIVQFVENPPYAGILGPAGFNSETESPSAVNSPTANIQALDFNTSTTLNSKPTASHPSMPLLFDDLSVMSPASGCSELNDGSQPKHETDMETEGNSCSSSKQENMEDMQDNSLVADEKTLQINTVNQSTMTTLGFQSKKPKERLSQIQNSQKAQSGQFDMDSILSNTATPSRSVSQGDTQMTSSFSYRFNVIPTAEAGSQSVADLSVHGKQGGEENNQLPRQEEPKASSSSMSFGRPLTELHAASNLEYPPGFRPMSDKLSFMAQRHMQGGPYGMQEKPGADPLEGDKPLPQKWWPDFGSIEWLDDSTRFVDISATQSEFLLVAQKDRALHTWPCNKNSVEQQNTAGGKLTDKLHELKTELGLHGERIKLLASSALRTTVLTESGKFATFYDKCLREAHHGTTPPLINQLSHSCQVFSSLKNEDVVDLQCDIIFTVAMTRSGKVFWWGLPPNNERQTAFRNIPSTHTDSPIKIGDIVGLKKQNNEVGSMVLNISDPLYPLIGIVRNVCGDSTLGAGDVSRKYYVDILEDTTMSDDATALDNDQMKTTEDNSTGECRFCNEDDEIRRINFASRKIPLSAADRDMLQNASPLVPNLIKRASKCEEDGDELSSKEEKSLRVWSGTDVLFLEESMSVLGEVVGIDGQFVVVCPTDCIKDESSDIFNKSYRVFFLSTVEKVTSEASAGSSSSICCRSRYGNAIQVTPKLIFGMPEAGTDAPKLQAICIGVSESGVSILVKRKKDGKVYLLHPECVKENNSKVFTCSKSSAVNLENITSEANVTQDFESVFAKTANLDWIPKYTSTSNLYGKRKGEDVTPSNDKARLSPVLLEEKRPKLRILGRPFATFLFDHFGCPYPIKFLSCLRDPPQLECGPLRDVGVIEYPSDEHANDHVVTIVAAIKPLHLIPLVVSGNKDRFLSIIKAIEKEAKNMKSVPTQKVIKRPRLSLSDSTNMEGTATESGRSILMVDEVETHEHGDPAISKSRIHWLDERCSGNQNLLHVCASNITPRNQKAGDKHYFDMFHGEAFMLSKLLESTHLWPWVSKLLTQRDATGCTPFMTALLAKNHHAAYYILKAVKKHDVTSSGKEYLRSVLCTPSFAGVTPVHQLIANASRRHSTPTFVNALRVTNIPTSYTPRMLLKLFKSRYASAYRACMPLIKSRWKNVTVRDRVKELSTAKSSQFSPTKSATETLAMPSTTQPTPPVAGGYLIGNRMTYGGERFQRANAIRASAKEGMIQFANVDEMYQALSEMNGFGVLSETDHPSGVLTSVVQHVLNVQVFDDPPSDSTSRNSNSQQVRRFQPISRSDSPYIALPTTGPQLPRNPATQVSQPSRGISSSATSNQETPSLPKGKEENIAKCFDDIVDYMVLARLLLVFPEAGALTSDTKETGLHTFLKHFNRYYPSTLCRLFLLWRPCGSKNCCYQKFSGGLDITPSDGRKLKSKLLPAGSTDAEKRATECNGDTLASEETKASCEATASGTVGLANQKSARDSPSFPPFVRSISTHLAELGQTVVPEYALETKDSAREKTNPSTVVEFSPADEPSTSGTDLAAKTDEGEQLMKAKDTKLDFFDPIKDSFMAPSPSIMTSKVLENVDLDQLDDRTDNLLNFEEQSNSNLQPADSEPHMISNTLCTSFSPQAAPVVRETFTSYPNGRPGSSLSDNVATNMESAVFENSISQSRFDVLQSSNGQQCIIEGGTGSYQVSGAPDITRCVCEPSLSGTTAEFELTTRKQKEFSSDQKCAESPSSSTDAKNECVCQETRRKLPLFDRFQAPVFQLAKNWPCIVASILGFYPRSDTEVKTEHNSDSERNAIEVEASHRSQESGGVEPHEFLPSAKLDTFTEALMSSPFDILLELIVKTIQLKLEQSQALTSFDIIRDCLETKLSTSPINLATDTNLMLCVAQRFVRSVVRQMSLFLGKHSPMEISLRYKIRKRGKTASKKEERLLLGLNVCLRAFSWLSVIELLRAAVATIEPVCNGTVKAQPKAIVSGLMGGGTGQMHQNILFRPNIRIHGPQSQSSSSSSVIGRMAMRINRNQQTSSDLRGTQFTDGQSQNPRGRSKVDSSMAPSSDTDSDEDTAEALEMRSFPSSRGNSLRDTAPEPMDITEDDEEVSGPSWSTGVRLRPESPSAWALNGHVTSASELSNRVVNRLFGSQPQENKASVVSLHHGNCYLARIFSRLVKEAVDLIRDLSDVKEEKTTDRTKPFDVQPLKFPDGVETQLKKYAHNLLDDTWSWMSKVLNNLERQLRVGQEYDTGHFVTRLQVPENELESNGFSRPTQSYTYISQPEEYLLYLIKAKMGEDRDSLPVLDLLSYSPVTFVLDAFIYAKKHWPGAKQTQQKKHKRRPSSGEHPSTHLNPSSGSHPLSEENFRFFGECWSRCNDDELLRMSQNIVHVAKQPAVWLKMPNSNGNGASKDPPRHCTYGILGQEESKNKRHKNEEVKKIHDDWKLTIASFCKLFLTEPPGYERESFLALEAGAAGRISRFQRSIMTLRTAFKTDGGFYVPGVNQDSVGVNPLLSVNVKRSDLLEDCLKVFLDPMDNHPYGSLRVRFEGEEGAGPGVNRGLFAGFTNCLKSGQKILNWPVGLLCRPGVLPEQGSIFAPVSGMRFCVQGDEPFHGKMTPFRRRMVFVAIGRFLGLTLWFNQTIPLILSRSVLKYLLHKEDEITFEDLAFHNASIFSAFFQMIIDARSEQITAKKFEDIYCMRFEAAVDDTVEEVIPGGSEVIVTPDNVLDYLRLYTKHVLVTRVENELEGMREGLHQMVPRELLDSLTPEDLQLLLSGGVETVDFARLKAIITFGNSRRCPKELFEKYKGWFWRIVRKMTSTQRQQLLYFATGSSVLPALDNRVGNNEELAITVDVIDGNTVALPVASTCGQRITLPLYATKKDLKKKLLQAIECQAYGLG